MTTTNINPLNRESQPAARHLLGLCSLVVCLVLAWAAFKPAAKVYPLGNHAAVSATVGTTPYDLAHDANYRTTVLFYTTRPGANALPF